MSGDAAVDDILKNLIKQFIPFAQKHIGFDKPPKLFLRRDGENAKNPLGKTAYYEPSKKSITLYITGRHPKDILRSLGHELVHHKQNCEGKFDHENDMGEGYAQENPHLRQMEIEANRDGSMCLRDFEDGLKKNNTIYYEHLQKGDKKMSLKDWKEKEIGTLLSEAWGFKFNSLQEFEEFDGKGELQAESEEEVTEEKEPIEFIISTYGGSAAEMFAIYDTMRMVKDECEIHTLGLGKVMSAGVLLLAAGTKGKRKIAKNCRVMMHSVIGGSAGAIHSLENEMEEIRFTQKQHIECLLEETNMTRAYLKRLLNKRVNVYLTAEEAVELGIADEIV